MSLFGCAPKRPLDYSGSAGLLWALNGERKYGIPTPAQEAVYAILKPYRMGRVR